VEFNDTTFATGCFFIAFPAAAAAAAASPAECAGARLSSPFCPLQGGQEMYA